MTSAKTHDPCDMLSDALPAFRGQSATARRWGERLARLLPEGRRLLVAGNGGSAAEAQHLTAELVGRYQHERPAFSAIALHADTSSCTAIGNDYGFDQLYARQVQAHGRAGDVLILLSTSGSSTNLLAAAEAGRRRGLTVWSLTGPGPNPLAVGSDESLCVTAAARSTVQELHLVAVHIMCGAFDSALRARETTLATAQDAAQDAGQDAGQEGGP